MGMFLPLLALAGTAAGAGLNMAANAEDTKAENNTVQQELNAQKGFQQRASNAYQQNVQKNAGAENAQAQIGQGASEAQRLYSMLQGAPTGQPVGLMAPSQQSQAGLQGLTQQSNAAASQIPGLGNWQTQGNIGNILTGSQIGSIDAESRNSAANLPSLLQGASRTGAGLSGLGGILGSLGMLSGVAGGLDSLGQGTTAGRFIQGLNPGNYNPLGNSNIQSFL